MGSELSHIARCLDLQERDIARAITTRDRTKALLTHLAALSAPNTGVAKVLLVLARMATTACDWIDGDLRIEVVAAGDATRVEVATDLGGGLSERLLSSMTFSAPLEEFTRAIERVPHMIAPLRVSAKSAARIVLGAVEIVRRTSLPPPPIEIAAESLFVHLPAPHVPRERADPSELPQLPVVPVRPPVVVLEPSRPVPVAPAGPSDPPPGDLDSGWDD